LDGVPNTCQRRGDIAAPNPGGREMFSTKKKITAALSLGFASVLVLAGCSMGADTAEEPAEPSTPETSETETAPETMDPAANLVGPGCEAYAEQVPDGAGSVA